MHTGELILEQRARGKGALLYIQINHKVGLYKQSNEKMLIKVEVRNILGLREVGYFME